MQKTLSTIPQAAWRRRFDQRAAKPGKPSRPLSPLFLLKILPMLLRMGRRSKEQKAASFDPVNTAAAPSYGDVMGVPLGGIGGGSITRGWRGDFLRWQLRAGAPHVSTVYADQFSLFVKRGGQMAQAQVLNPDKPTDRQLQTWKWELPEECATYHALFPLAWTVYEQPLPGVRLTCKQVSPVIPHNYQESSYPAAVFEWTLENLSSEKITIGLMFTFQNGMGLENDQEGGHWNKLFTGKKNTPNNEILGIQLHHHYRQLRLYETGKTHQRERFLPPTRSPLPSL